MASNHTDKLGLSLWAANDPVLRADFNSDNQKLEAAYKYVPRMVWGSYTGDGTFGAENPNDLHFTFTPCFVVILTASTYAAHPAATFINGISSLSGLGHYESSAYAMKLKISWGDNSVSWYTQAETAAKQLNDEGVTYSFFAIGLDN